MSNNTTKPTGKGRQSDRVRVKIQGAWTAVPNRLLLDKRLSHSARLLCALIFMHAANSGKAFPSQKQLAEELATFNDKDQTEKAPSIRSVQRWLSELQEAGWLEWRQTMRNNEYTLYDPYEPEQMSVTTPVSPSTPQNHDCHEKEQMSATTLVSPTATGESPHTTLVSPHTTPVSHSSIYIDSSCIDSSTTESRDVVVDERLVKFLLNEGMSAAHEFAGLDYNTAREDFHRRRQAGQAISTIVRAWRAQPPQPSVKTETGPIDPVSILKSSYGDLFKSGDDLTDYQPIYEDQGA
jgi:hypothetical protein